MGSEVPKLKVTGGVPASAGGRSPAHLGHAALPALAPLQSVEPPRRPPANARSTGTREWHRLTSLHWGSFLRHSEASRAVALRLAQGHRSDGSIWVCFSGQG